MIKFLIFVLAFSTYLLVPISFIVGARNLNLLPRAKQIGIFIVFVLCVLGLWVAGYWIAVTAVTFVHPRPDFGHAFGAFFSIYVPIGFLAFICLVVALYRRLFV